MIGQTISHYRILEKIGEGGMGVVYKAEDIKLHRTVALKFLPLSRSVTKDQSNRFIREAQAAASLSHPNIATVFEFNEVEEPSTHTTQAFIAMEYVDGNTLDKVIRGGPLPFDQIRTIAEQVGQGLQSAHARAIIHRDIKPSNIIINNEGVAKLLDFGLAKLAQETSLSQTRTVAGSVAYMSPEQVRGEKLDARSDIWSFGVVLYQMLTGKLPFRGDHTAAMMYSITNEPIPEIVSLRPGSPANLVTLCNTCLEKDRESRPRSMQIVLQLLGSNSPGQSAVLRKVRPLLLRVALSIGLIAAITAGLWLLVPTLFTHQPTKQTRIGILPFRNMTKLAATNDWPLLIQMIMVDNLSNFEEIRIADPFSLNGLVTQTAGVSSSVRVMNVAEIEYLVDGMIQWKDSSYVLFCTMTEQSSGEVRLSRSITLESEEKLQRAIQTLSEEVLSFFQIQQLVSDRKQDLQPWLTHRPRNLAAIRAFLQGSQLAWNMQPGAAKYYRQAIELDSTFITPRTWLIAGLVTRGELEKGRREYQSLLKLEPSANPFEQALIRWSGACVSDDLAGQAQALEHALEYSPKNNVLLYLLASIYYTLGDYTTSVARIQPAIDMKWPFHPAYYLMALGQTQIQRYQDARQTLERSLSVGRVLPNTYSLLSALSIHEGDTAQAEDYAKQCLRDMGRNDVSLDNAYAALADDYSAARLPRQAASFYRKALEHAPSRAELHTELGSLLVQLGILDSAQIEFQLAVHYDSSSKAAHRRLGELFELKTDTVNALLYYGKFLSLDSTSNEGKTIRQRILTLSR